MPLSNVRGYAELDGGLDFVATATAQIPPATPGAASTEITDTFILKTDGQRIDILLDSLNFNPPANTTDLTAFDGGIYFASFTTAFGSEPARYTPENGFEILADIDPTGSSFPDDFTVHDGSLYFIADRGPKETQNFDYRLWRYDGRNLTQADDGQPLANLALGAVSVGSALYYASSPESVGEVRLG